MDSFERITFLSGLLLEMVFAASKEGAIQVGIYLNGSIPEFLNSMRISKCLPGSVIASFSLS